MCVSVIRPYWPIYIDPTTRDHFPIFKGKRDRGDRSQKIFLHLCQYKWRHCEIPLSDYRWMGRREKASPHARNFSSYSRLSPVPPQRQNLPLSRTDASQEAKRILQDRRKTSHLAAVCLTLFFTSH